MSSASHSVDVVPVSLLPCPNADSLSIVRIGGFQVVARTVDWEGVTQGAYVPPDSLVDTKLPVFSFLAKQAGADGFARIRAVKLRGNVSMGLLVPAPPGAVVGDDVTAVLQVLHYQPELKVHGTAKGTNRVPPADAARGPSLRYAACKYDLENGRKPRFSGELEGYEVVVTEKIHGENARYQWDGETFHAGSRNYWRVEGSAWHTHDSRPDIEMLCKEIPGHTVYGELYGGVGGYPYDAVVGRRFRCFDIADPLGNWLSHDAVAALCFAWGIDTVPVLWRGTYDPTEVAKFADGYSTLNPKHIREGCVAASTGCNRVKLKWHGAEFLVAKHGGALDSEGDGE